MKVEPYVPNWVWLKTFYTTLVSDFFFGGDFFFEKEYSVQIPWFNEKICQNWIFILKITTIAYNIKNGA
jgi:hypothetical protein